MSCGTPGSDAGAVPGCCGAVSYTHLEDDEEVEQEVLPLKPMERKASSSSTGVSVKGVGDVWIKLARCCMPVPGDNIIGFITRNQGVSVHRTDCQNMIDLKNKQPERVRCV